MAVQQKEFYYLPEKTIKKKENITAAVAYSLVI